MLTTTCAREVLLLLVLMMMMTAANIYVRGDIISIGPVSNKNDDDDEATLATLLSFSEAPSITMTLSSSEEPSSSISMLPTESNAPSATPYPSSFPSLEPSNDPTFISAMPSNQLSTNNKPTMMMAPSDSPSSVVGTDDEPATGVPSSPPFRQRPPAAGQSCEQCKAYSSLMEIQRDIDNAGKNNKRARLCICPQDFYLPARHCPQDDSIAALVIDKGKEIILECFVPDDNDDYWTTTATTTGRGQRECIFGCRGSIAHVQNGALIVVGNLATVFTGGLLYSRVVVERTGFASFELTRFERTAAAREAPPEDAKAAVIIVEENDDGNLNNVTSTTTSNPTTTTTNDSDSDSGVLMRAPMMDDERRRIIASNGKGGAIECHGEMDIVVCDFVECTSLFDGGAIWAGNDANITILSSLFANNTATSGLGGAIYSDGYIYMEETLFEGNLAAEGGDDIAGAGVIEGCGNVGIGESSPSCDEPADEATSSEAAATSSLPYYYLAVPSVVCILLLLL